MAVHSQLPTAGNKDLNDALHIPLSLRHCRQYLFTISALYEVKMKNKKINFLFLKFQLSPRVPDLKQLSFFLSSLVAISTLSISEALWKFIA